jgi:hypothetical protein
MLTGEEKMLIKTSIIIDPDFLIQQQSGYRSASAISIRSQRLRRPTNGTHKHLLDVCLEEEKLLTGEEKLLIKTHLIPHRLNSNKCPTIWPQLKSPKNSPNFGNLQFPNYI